MLTLKFDTDNFCLGAGATTLMIEAQKFRTVQHRNGLIDIFVANEHGVEISYPVAHGDSHFSRRFVMNSAGQTVARYLPVEAAEPSETNQPAD